MKIVNEKMITEPVNEFPGDKQYHKACIHLWTDHQFPQADSATSKLGMQAY